MTASTGEPVPSRGRIASILGVAFVGGAGTMTVELAAVRLLAPWFGTSQIVWTNVIAVVLLALAAGYLAGARLASRPEPLALLGRALIGAGLLAALLPAVAPFVSELFVPRDVALHEAAGLVTWGSLAASCLLFLPPALLLGTVAPLAVEAVQHSEHGRAGRAGGEVLCVSTLGSLAGVFGTSHLWIPWLGLRGTFLLAGVVLVAAGLTGLLVARAGTRRAAALAAVALAGAAFWPASTPRLGPKTTLLARAESPYQTLRVVEDTSWDEPLRFLQVNEGFDSYQSVWAPRTGLLPRGFYYNDFALPAFWSEAQGPWRVLVLGLGAGTAWRVLAGAHPAGVELFGVGIELDPVVVELARTWLDLPHEDPHLEVAGGLDARLGLRQLAGPFDEIVLDCYANQVEMPPHLVTLEFFAEVRERLGPGGWLVANLGGFGFEDPIVAAVANTVATAFEAPVLILRVPAARNFTLFARRDAALPLDAETGALASAGVLDDFLAARRLPGFARVVQADPVGRLLRDDHAPVEALQRRSIEEGRERFLEGVLP